MKISKELINKAKQCKSPQELLELAKQNDVEMSEQQAEKLIERLKIAGEISDEELANVSGGGCDAFKVKCPKCGSTNNSARAKGIYDLFHCNDCGHEWKETFYY